MSVLLKNWQLFRDITYRHAELTTPTFIVVAVQYIVFSVPCAAPVPPATINFSKLHIASAKRLLTAARHNASSLLRPISKWASRSLARSKQILPPTALDRDEQASLMLVGLSYNLNRLRTKIQISAVMACAMTKCFLNGNQFVSVNTLSPVPQREFPPSFWEIL